MCTVTAALGHLAGGGVIPSTTALMAFVGAALIAWLLSARRVTGGQLFGLLVLCQVCVHFSSSMASMDMSALMVATHIIATVVSAGILTRGEAFAWHLAERLGLRALPLLSNAHLVPLVRLAEFVLPVRALRNAFLEYVRVERGPPVLSL